MKKIFSLLLTAILIVSIIPLGAFTITVNAADYYTFTVTAGKASLTSVDASLSGAVVVPSEWNGFAVTDIGEYAFYNCDNITSITLPDSITTIGKVAFGFCDQLKSASISDSVEVIGYGAFSDCVNLETVSLGKKVTSIGDYAFANCTKLKNATLPDSVTEIGDSAFASCKGLKNAVIGNGVKTVGKYAFAWCDSLAKVTVGDGVEAINEGAFGYCRNLKTVNLGDGIKSIGAFAFCESSVTDIVIPNGVTTIGNSAFENCDKLTNITLPSNIEKIDSYAFYGCKSVSKVWYKGSDTTQINVGLYNEPLTAAIWYCGNWQRTVSATGVYEIKPYTVTDTVEISDSGNNKVVYNENIGGWPMIKGQKYAVKFKCAYGDKLSNTLSWYLTRKSDVVFTDTSADQWYNDPITYVSGAGLMTGYGGTDKFGVADKIQRQDFVVILARMAGVDLSQYDNAENRFTDVPNGEYYTNAILWAVDAGITTGYAHTGGTVFGVGDPITREQLVTFLYRYAKHANGGDAPTVSDNAATTAAAYPDFAAVNDFAKDAVIWSLDKGVIKGQGGTHIAPANNSLRCEVAQIIYNISSKNLI